MPDTPESTRSDLAQLAAGSDSEDQREEKNSKNGSNVSMSAFNFVSSIIGSGIIGKSTHSPTPIHSCTANVMR
jgi:hypothetical protein